MASFDIEGAKKAGYSDAEIADHLAQQAGFDSAGARKAGYSDAEIIQHVAAPKVNQLISDGVKSGNDSVQLRKDILGGLVRGAGSIGATLLTPIDAAARALGVKNDYIGRTDRREAMDAGLQTMGVDADSLGFKGGKLVSEIAGTAGAGGATANVLTKVAPKAVQAAPALVQALRTGGMSAGGAKGVTGAAVRAVGGGVNGAISAGMVNPEDAGTGAVVGAVAPNVIKVAGEAGQIVGKNAASKYAEALAKYNRGAPMRETLKESIDAGYVVPPNMVNPSTKNAIIESFSGKQATSQLASVKNQDVTEKLVRKSLGLADDTPLTKGALEQIRKVEGGAYKAVGSLNPKAEMDLEALKLARNEAQGWFNAYNRSASPADLAKAKDARDLAEVLELQLESHAKAAGKDSLIPALREARKQIAKTYTVERALNDSTGTVNAKVIGRMFDKGKPLSDGLETVGRFANGFPSIAQAPQQMGSPGAHNLRAALATALGGGGLAALGPAGLAAAAAPYAAGSASRALMFREGAQKALANKSAPTIANSQKLAELLKNPEVQQMLARTAPVAISADR
jgi:ribosomal protein L29